MKPTKYIQISFIVIVLFFSSLCGADSNQSLHFKLDKAYNNYRNSIINKSHVQLKKYSSKNYYNSVRNAVISYKYNFPDELFKIPATDISKLNFLMARQNGKMANSVYFGALNLLKNNKGEPNKGFFITRFIFEDGTWKYLKNEQIPDNEFTLSSKITEEYILSYLGPSVVIPDGEVPPSPPLCKSPDYIAFVTITTKDIDTKVNINGFDYEKADGKYPTSSSLIIGGLTKGENQIAIISNPTENASDPKLIVTIRARKDNDSREFEVWKYERILGEKQYNYALFIEDEIFQNTTNK